MSEEVAAMLRLALPVAAVQVGLMLVGVVVPTVGAFGAVGLLVGVLRGLGDTRVPAAVGGILALRVRTRLVGPMVRVAA